MFLEFLPDCNHSREYKEEKDNNLTSRSLQSRKEVYNHIHYVKYVFSIGKQLPGQSVSVSAAHWKGGQTGPPGTPLPSQQCLDWVNTAAKRPAKGTPLLAMPSSSCPI